MTQPVEIASKRREIAGTIDLYAADIQRLADQLVVEVNELINQTPLGNVWRSQHRGDGSVEIEQELPGMSKQLGCIAFQIAFELAAIKFNNHPDYSAEIEVNHGQPGFPARFLKVEPAKKLSVASLAEQMLERSLPTVN